MEGEEQTDQDVDSTEMGNSSVSSVDTPKKIDSDEAQKSKEITEVKDEELDTKVRQETKPIKKRGRENGMKRMMSEMMDKVMKLQEENDRKFLELEEKRIRLEEYQLEREERMKRDERVSTVDDVYANGRLPFCTSTAFWLSTIPRSTSIWAQLHIR